MSQKENKIIVFRKASTTFHSIENVFNVLMPHLKAKKVELPYASQGLWKRLKNILFLLRQERYIIHITGHDHYLLWYPFKNAILTIHDVEALKRKKGLKRWLFKKLWFDWPIRNAKIITTISEFSKAEILALGNYSTPIKVIHNPLPLDLPYQLKYFSIHQPRLLQIGTKTNKNLSRLIKALKGIDCHLVIVGQANDALKSELQAAGIQYSIKSNLSNAEMIAEYQKADLLTFVSTYEGFGLPIIEAQAIGRPVITSNLASMPEVAGEGALLVNPFSVSEIRKGLLQLIENKKLRDDLIQKGLENVKRFDAETIAKQYLELYDSLGN